MNYQHHYDQLIDRARTRTLKGYVEKHHVVPKCMGGGNDAENIVRLTAQEHFVAHQLLVKLHPSVPALATVTMLMAKGCANNKVYGWLRKRNAAALSMMPERSAKISASLKGNTHAHGNRGKQRIMSPEWRAKVAMWARALPKRKKGCWSQSSESREKMSATKKKLFASGDLCQKGENNNCSKLTAVDVRYIRLLASAERHKQKDIAALLGVAISTVSMIINRKAWV